VKRRVHCGHCNAKYMWRKCMKLRRY
jgi:hypothetical protein